MTDTVIQPGQKMPEQPKTVAQVLGEVTWLLTQSPLHKQMFLSDLEWFCMPAILLEQFRMFYGPGAATPTPAAVALWATVSEEIEQRLEAGGTKLRPDEWKSGDRPWLLELVAPFGGQDEILKDLTSSVFGGKPFKFHTTTPEGHRVVTSSDTATPEPH